MIEDTDNILILSLQIFWRDSFAQLECNKPIVYYGGDAGDFNGVYVICA